MKYLQTIILALALSACGKALPVISMSGGGNTGTNGGDAPAAPIISGGGLSAGNPVLPVNKSITLNSSSGSVLAYVLDISTNIFNVYIPSTKAYAQVNQDGSYVNGGAYYSETNCQGTVMAAGWVGISGNAIIYVNSEYYKVTGSQSTPFAYESFFSGSSCANITGSTSTIIGIVELTTQPYDFTTLAPLTPTYN